MCGGAIISDFIAPVGPRQLTADYLWGDRKKPTSGRRFSKPIVDIDDDFEQDFQGFKDDDESDIDEEEEVLVQDVKPFAFSAPRSSGKPLHFIFYGGLKVNIFWLVLVDIDVGFVDQSLNFFFKFIYSFVCFILGDINVV